MAQPDKALELAAQHYASLHEFLVPHLDSLQQGHGQSKQRAIASDKLSRLTVQQFFELSVDVYDELQRRLADNGEPFLAISNEFHPKRNQARQKLAVLPLPRFRALASDVHSELEFRYPMVAADIKARFDANPPPPHKLMQQQGGPAPPQAQLPPAPMSAGMMQPGMPTLQDLGAPRSATPQFLGQAAGPPRAGTPQQGPPPARAATPQMDMFRQQQSQQLASQGFANGSRLQADGKASLDTLMSDLGNLMSNPDLADDASRALIQSLKVRIAELEDQIENERVAHARSLAEAEAATQREQQKFKELDKKYNDLFSDNQHLRQDYASLQDDYNEQQQIAADIRSEATNLLEEIKALSKKNEELKDQNDIQMETIRRLRDEIAGLQKSQQPRQNGYGNGSGQQDAQSRGAPDADAPPPSYSGQMRKNVNIDYEQDDIIDAGIIGMQFVESYRSAVADLIRASRSETPTSVLVAMKGIVIACRSITEDSEAYENNPDCGLDDYERSELIDVKNKLSMSLTNQMGIAKELATNFSSGTVSSLEAATADLSATIVELLHIYQRHTGLSNPIERPPAQSNPAQPTAGDAQGENYGIEELKVFLERQTDLIVQAIQSLLLAMRQSSSFGQDFIDTVGTITRIVDNLVRVSRVTLGKPQAAAFRDSSEPILQELSVANVRLNELGEAMVASPQSKTLKQKIASSSYDIAKFVKELISLIE